MHTPQCQLSARPDPRRARQPSQAPGAGGSLWRGVHHTAGRPAQRVRSHARAGLARGGRAAAAAAKLVALAMADLPANWALPQLKLVCWCSTGAARDARGVPGRGNYRGLLFTTEDNAHYWEQSFYQPDWLEQM